MSDTDQAERPPSGPASDSLAEMVGGLAHDLNNLLAVVIATADRLQTGPVPEEKRPLLLSNIRQAAEVAAEVTGQLLTLTRTSRVGLPPQGEIPPVVRTQV